MCGDKHAAGHVQRERGRVSDVTHVQGLGLTPEEIAQRKAQLETQRQRILAAKKKEREVSLSLCSLLWLSVYHASLRVSRGRLAMSDARCVGRR